MQRITTSSILAILLSFMFILPVLAADNVDSVTNPANVDSVTNPNNVDSVTNPNNVDGCSGQLCNPLQADDIITFITQIIEVILKFALPIIILFIMYGGYLLVIAQGNPAKITEARNAIFAAVIGGVIVLGTQIIITVIKSTVAALGA